MSTRSVIARRQGDGWKGVYHHGDGYPTGLGCYLFRLIRQHYSGDVERFLSEAIDAHPKGWSTIFGLHDGIEKAGKANIPERSGRADCYCHGTMSKRADHAASDAEQWIEGCDCQDAKHGDEPACDPLFMEYVYVFDAETKTMAVLGGVGEDLGEQDPALGFPHNKRVYRHKILAVVRLDGDEPDWWDREFDKYRDDEDWEPMKRNDWVAGFLPPVEFATA